MKKITIREFQTNAIKYIEKDLPIILMKYDKPVAIVRKYASQDEIERTGKTINFVSAKDALKETENSNAVEKSEREVVTTNSPERSTGKAIIHGKKKAPARNAVINKGGDPRFQFCPKHEGSMRMTCGCTE